MHLECMIVGGMRENCYLVWQDGGNEAIVIDPGDSGDRIADRLEELGLKCAAILLTHGHFDHIMGVAKLKERTGALVIAGASEAELLNNSELNVSKRVRRPTEIVCDRLLGDMEYAEIAGCRFKCIYTPGHTIGSVCYHFEDQKILFTGDTLFERGVGRTDLPTGDEVKLYESIKSRLFVLPSDTKCYPGHGGATDIGSESKYFRD